MALDRRGILKFIAGGVVGTALTPMPYKITDDISIWTQNWPWISNVPKGKVNQKPSLLKWGGGTSDYGIMINTVDGRPVTASGNPDHPLSLGGIDPVAAASIQLLYSPARLKTPVQKDKNKKFQPITWQKARQILGDKLSPLKKQNNTIAWISGDESSSSNEIFSSFLSQMGSEKYFFLPSDQATQQVVWQKLMHGQGSIGYDLENADLVLSINADIFDSWGTFVRNQKCFQKGQKTFLYAGPFQNSTAAISQEWFPISSDSSAELCLSIAYYLFMLASQDSTINLPGYYVFQYFVMNNFSPDKTNAKIGLSQEKIKNLTQRILKAKRPLIIVGTNSGQGGRGLAFFAGLALNSLLGRINSKGGLTCIPKPPQVVSSSMDLYNIYQNDLVNYLQRINSGQEKVPEAVFISEANPLYSLPQPELMAKALNKIPLKVSFSQFMDETAAQADLILPNPHFLERLDDSFSPFGSAEANYSISSPIIEPQVQARSTPDFILELKKQLGLNREVSSYKKLLQNKTELLGANWQDLNQGKAWIDKKTKAEQYHLRLWNQKTSKFRQDLESNKKDINTLVLALKNQRRTGIARTAIPPLCLKALRDDETKKELLAVCLNSKTASEQGLSDGDFVKLQSMTGIIKAFVLIDESVMDQVIVAYMGFGHTDWDQFSQGLGGNVNNLLNISLEKSSQRTVWSDTRVKIMKI